jgi:hypothetical protein
MENVLEDVARKGWPNASPIYAEEQATGRRDY